MEKQLKKIIIITIFLSTILSCYVFIVLKIFNTWTIRGQFGDMFGSVNTIFSMLAFLGLIYTIIIQKDETTKNLEIMEKQLEEMKVTRMLQFQPFPIPEIIGINIEKPRFYYSPCEKEHNFYSRYFFKYKIYNDSENIALNLICAAKIFYFNDKGNKELVSKFKGLEYVKTKKESKEQRIMFNSDSKNNLLSSILEGNFKKMPMLKFELIYKNCMGSCFYIEQIYHIDIKNKKEGNIMKTWLKKINTFFTEYKNEIEILQSKNDKILFDNIRKESSESLEDYDLNLACIKRPNTFKMKVIENSEYEEIAQNIKHGTLIPTFNKKCLGEL